MLAESCPSPHTFFASTTSMAMWKPMSVVALGPNGRNSRRCSGRHTVRFPQKSLIAFGIFLLQTSPQRNSTSRMSCILAGPNGHGLTPASNSPVASTPMVALKERIGSISSLVVPRKVQCNYSMGSTSVPKVRVSRI